MIRNEGVGKDRYLAPGTRVRRDAFVEDADHTRSEFGIVVHCWRDRKIGMFDCYVAFFADGFPNGRPDKDPYVVRNAAVGLAELTANAHV